MFRDYSVTYEYITKSKISSTLKIIGLVLFLWPFGLVFIAYALSFVFWCDIQMAGVVEAVDCAINVTFIETIIALFINLHWFALLTTIPSLIILGIGVALSPKSSGVSTDQQIGEVTKTSKLAIVVSKVSKWSLIILGGFFLFNLLVALGISFL